MQAMIFAAGLGTRLKPLTDHLPKALVPINGKPLLQWNIEKLRAAGFTRIVINVHHFPTLIRDFLASNKNFGIDIFLSDEQEELLDTGGGLLKASRFFSDTEPVLAHNVDVISNLDLSDLMRYHQEQDALATLAVRNRNTQRYLLFDSSMRLTGWTNIKTNEILNTGGRPVEEYTPLAFNGIQVIGPEIFTQETGRGRFSIIDTYLKVARENKIIGYLDNSALWMDVGRKEQLEEAGKLMKTFYYR